MGFVRRVCCSHSRMLGRSAARALSVPCTLSGTSRICTIFDMLHAYKHVRHTRRAVFIIMGWPKGHGRSLKDGVQKLSRINDGFRAATARERDSPFETPEFPLNPQIG